MVAIFASENAFSCGGMCDDQLLSKFVRIQNLSVFHAVFDGARYRVRTCRGSAGYQALIERDAHIDAHAFGHDSELREVVSVWPALPLALKAAVLALVRAHQQASESSQELRQEHSAYGTKPTNSRKEVK
jgi:hypothetical protein